MTMKKRPLPAKLTAELNCMYPRWTCYVTDNVGTANGGFWKGFATHAAMDAWLERSGYATGSAPVS